MSHVKKDQDLKDGNCQVKGNEGKGHEYLSMLDESDGHDVYDMTRNGHQEKESCSLHVGI